MANYFDLIIQTPTGIEINERATSLYFKNVDGDLTGVLPNHMPCISLVSPSQLTYINEKNEHLYFIIGEGVVKIVDNQVIFMVDFFLNNNDHAIKNPKYVRAQYFNQILTLKLSNMHINESDSFINAELEEEVAKFATIDKNI